MKPINAYSLTLALLLTLLLAALGGCGGGDTTLTPDPQQRTWFVQSVSYTATGERYPAAEQLASGYAAFTTTGHFTLTLTLNSNPYTCSGLVLTTPDPKRYILRPADQSQPDLTLTLYTPPGTTTERSYITVQGLMLWLYPSTPF
jgi:hypothetical protein